MKVQCTKNEFVDLLDACSTSDCEKCVLHSYCGYDMFKDVDFMHRFASVCDVTDGTPTTPYMINTPLANPAITACDTATNACSVAK